MMLRPAMLALAMVAATAAGVQAQRQAQVSRERVVEAWDYIEVIAGAGDSQTIVIEAPSLVDKTWRFWIRAPRATANLSIRDVVSGEEVGFIPQDRLINGTWSPYLNRLTVMFDISASAEMEIEMIGFPQVSVDTQTPVGVLNLLAVRDMELPFELRRLTRAVGQLSIIEGRLGTGSEVFFTYCTAFMISARHALTAEHCVAGGLEDKHSELVLGFVDDGNPDGEGRHQVSVLAKSRPLDVALLSVTPPVEEGDVFKVADSEPGALTELLVLQHFGGEPLSISNDEDCAATASLFDGPIHVKDGGVNREPEVMFGHGCDTTKSSSGAPVIDRESYAVVGVHQRGYGSGESQENRALRRDALHAFLAEKLSNDE